MKVKVYYDEEYPVYGLGDSGDEVDLDDATVARIKAARAEFDACQRIMREAFRSATGYVAGE